MGRVGDYTIVFPYGHYADLPADTLLLELKPGVAIPVTVKRPGDTEQDEPTFFHPVTNTRIICRNNGDLDILTDDTTAGDVNIQTVNANITTSGDVNATIGGDLNADVTGDINATCEVADITAGTSVDVHSPVTNLGDGGQPIARLGDSVEVIVTGGSSAGTHSGTITGSGVNTSI